MSELDEAWALALAEAERRARLSGRNDLAEYLALRNSNDELRRVGSEWLITTFVGLAAEANRAGSGIQSETEDRHRFQVGNSNMVGTSLTLRSGVRKLLIEVGWPRTPRDGFVRGGGLACGGIKHVGLKSANEELLLIRSPKGTPGWVRLNREGSRIQLHEADARKHLKILLDQS